MLKIQNKIHLSWDDIQTLVDQLCEWIDKSELVITSVTGIQRGGLIPAVMISHKLNLPYVYSIHPNTLVIDDICDTGVTLKNYVGIHTAVLHHKPHTSNFTPTFYAEIHEGDEFIYYPWERNDAEPIADYLK